jgi:hypothetical protein
MNEKVKFKKMLTSRQPDIEMWNKYPYWKNLHRIPSEEFHSKLYRVEAFDNFKNNIENNQLFFSHPNVWLIDDRLDSILLRLNITLPDGTVARQGYYDETFCQCWSIEDSMKMWEEYAKDEKKSYIKMVTNLDSIMKIFDNTSIFKGYSGSFWAGKVNYENFNESDETIKLRSEGESQAFFNTELISKLYLEKRSKFDFENEVRIIAFHRKDRKGMEFAFVEPAEGETLAGSLFGIIIDPRLKEKGSIAEIKLFAAEHSIKVF